MRIRHKQTGLYMRGATPQAGELHFPDTFICRERSIVDEDGAIVVCGLGEAWEPIYDDGREVKQGKSLERRIAEIEERLLSEEGKPTR